MSKNNLINNQWFDIINPVPPDSDALLWSLIAISILLIVSLAAQFIWKRQPRQILFRQIKWLTNTTSISPKQRLRLLEQSLCQYFSTTLLSKIPLTHPGWISYAQTLQQACYQSGTIKHSQARELLQQARSILREKTNGLV